MSAIAARWSCGRRCIASAYHGNGPDPPAALGPRAAGASSSPISPLCFAFAAHLFTNTVYKDAVEPGPDGAAPPPLAALADRALQRVLHQIICRLRLVDQSQRIAPEPGISRAISQLVSSTPLSSPVTPAPSRQGKAQKVPRKIPHFYGTRRGTLLSQEGHAAAVRHRGRGHATSLRQDERTR